MEEKVLVPRIYMVYGYMTTSIQKKSFRVHYLVCLAFHGPNPIGKTEIDHINRIRSDNRAENLRWANREDQGKNKNNTIKVQQICPTTEKVIASYDTMAEAIRKTGCLNIKRVVHEKGTLCGGFKWKRAEEDSLNVV